MKFIITYLTIISCFSAAAQDTISVYFGTNKARIDSTAKRILDNFIYTIDISTVDSIQYIGYADSVGNMKSNMRLSEKRARNTQRYTKKLLPEGFKTSIYAKGEATRKNNALNRRVDLIIYSKPIPKPERIIEAIDPQCFKTETIILAYCNVRNIVKRKREYVLIETEHYEDVVKEELYYVVAQKDGKASIRRVRWKKKVTGKLWWQKTRWVTTLPKRYFDQFQLFTLLPGPCELCSEELLGTTTKIVNSKRLYTDVFLMNNAQVKFGFIRQNQVKIRVPKIYVDTSAFYYYRYNSAGGEINWVTKKGRWRRDYFYLNLPVYDNRTPVIQKIQPVSYCVSERDYFGEGDSTPWPGCASFFPPGKHLDLNIDLGAFYQRDTLVGYLALGISRTTNKTFWQVQGGINSHLNFYGSGRYQQHFYDFPLKALSLRNRWERPAAITEYVRYGRVFLGTEFKTSFRDNEISFFEQNIHMGIVFVQTFLGARIPRVEIRGGMAYDYLGITAERLYPTANISCTFRLATLHWLRN